MPISVYRMIYKHEIMSGRPEFYSGRGARLSDLNSEILEKFHQAITVEYGTEQAATFVKMVADMESLSATAFLNRLYTLEAYNWQYAPRKQEKKEGFDVGPDNGGRLATGLASVASFMSNGDADQTEDIRYMFLSRHRSEFDSAAYFSKPRKIMFGMMTGEYY